MKFYEEKLQRRIFRGTICVGFFAERFVSGLVRERTIREKLTSDGVRTPELLDVRAVLKYHNVTYLVGFFAERFVSGLVREKNDPREAYQ